jgi:hypothetical protein
MIDIEPVAGRSWKAVEALLKLKAFTVTNFALQPRLLSDGFLGSRAPLLHFRANFFCHLNIPKCRQKYLAIGVEILFDPSLRIAMVYASRRGR